MFKEIAAPMAHKLRPKTLQDFKGLPLLQKKYPFLFQHKPFSLVIFGPPGVGKTSLAQILSKEWQLPLWAINAVESGIKDIKNCLKEMHGSMGIWLIDEIHRLNKTEQDYLLPLIESGQVILIGATTEWPKTYLSQALLSRLTLIELPKLTTEDIFSLLKKANTNTSELDLQLIAESSNGDARTSFNLLERLNGNIELLNDLREANRPLYKEETISAFIKSMRGSDVQAALLWLAVMLDAGVDPLYIARRLIIFASEDVGNADPSALTLAVSTLQALKEIGMPEGRITLSQATSYLSLTYKSNRCYTAINEALSFVKQRGNIPVPLHLTALKKHEYRYPHDAPNAKLIPPQDYTGLNHPLNFYRPSSAGREEGLKKRLEELSSFIGINKSR